MFTLIAVAVILIGLAHWYIKESYSFWKKKGVPNPKTTLFVGNIGPSLIMRENMGKVYEKMYNDYRDCSYIGFYSLLKPGVLLRSVDLIKEITTKEFASFHDNDIEIDEDVDPLFGKNPFVLKGERWKAVRTQVTSAITSGKVNAIQWYDIFFLQGPILSRLVKFIWKLTTMVLIVDTIVSMIKQMFTYMSNISEELVQYLNRVAGNCGKDGINAKDLSAKFTTNVVAACAFGLDGKAFTDPNSEFMKMGKRLFNFSAYETLRNTILFVMPQLSKLLKISFVTPEVRDWFIGTLQQTIKYREENNVVRNDYLDMMISLKNKPGEYQFTDMDVMAQSMTFYSDGMETSATALSLTLYEIARNPDVQEKLRKEIDIVLAKHNGKLEYEAIQEMQYLDMVISESLRKYPPAMFLLKVCTKQFTLPPPRGQGTGPGVVIEPGMTVILPVIGIHYDPQYYPDPEKFDPERFTDEAKKNRPKCAFMPFGEGPRMCLGFRFALAQIKAALVQTVSNFKIKLNPKTTPKMEVDPMSLILAKKGGIWLDFNKISK